MTEPFAELAGLDRLIHDPSRLAILTSLAACQDADFTFLQRLTALNKGTLSKHLSRLEDAGLVVITKRFVGKTPNTLVALSDAGRAAIQEHWATLERLHQEAQAWDPPATRRARPAEAGG
jgi:DNA-binding transcriptional ArsR family regulator